MKNLCCVPVISSEFLCKYYSWNPNFTNVATMFPTFNFQQLDPHVFQDGSKSCDAWTSNFLGGNIKYIA